MAFLIALAADFLAFGQRINEYLLISYSVFFVVYYAVKIATRQQLFNSLLKLLLSE